MKNNLILLLLLIPGTSIAAGNKVTDSLEVISPVANSPAELFKGRVSGVHVSSIDGSPNGEFNVNIRGLNTLRGDSQPLWIVDGTVLGSSLNENLNAFFQTGGELLDETHSILPDYSGRSYTSPVGNFGWLNPYEIESIEIIKDLSAAAIYGLKGANGVILIKTKRASSGECNVRVNSNAGVSMTPQKGEAFAPGLIQTHSIKLDGLVGNNSNYGISAFFRGNNSAVKRTTLRDSGVAIHFDSRPGTAFSAGLNSFLAYGRSSSTGGVNYFGSPSTMVMSRIGEDLFRDSVEGWLGDHDDDVENYRAVNSAWARITFLPGFYINAEGGMDYQNHSRYIWFGDATSFGKDFEGADAILNNSLFTYNAEGNINFIRNIAIRHHMELKAGMGTNGYMNRTNSMCASKFELPFLRSLGMSSAGSLNSIRKFAQDYNVIAFFGMLKYDYDGWGGLDIIARADKNSRYDKEYLVFPSVQAYLNPGKLPIFKKSAVSTFRINGGYGIAGHETAMPYEYISSYMATVPEVEAGTENYYEGLHRLISREFQFGIDLGFIRDRICFSVKYFDKSTDDKFRIFNFGKKGNHQWVRTSRWSILDDVTSTLENKGIEFDGNFRIVSGKDCSWTVSANLSFCSDNSFSLSSDDDPSLKSISETNIKVVPDFFGGAGTSFRFRRWTLDASLSGVSGAELINACNLVACGKTEISPEDFCKADYLRFDHLALTYDIPLNISKIKGMKVIFSAHNPFILTNYDGWNPDVNCFGVNVRNEGVDYGSFPVFRSFVLGASITF